MLEFVLLVGVVLAALFTAVFWWGVSEVKRYFDLDPGGAVLSTLGQFEQWAVDWIMDEAQRLGEDLEDEDTRYKYVQQAVLWLSPRIGKVMDAMDYSQDDLKSDIERLVRKQLDRVTE